MPRSVEETNPMKCSTHSVGTATPVWCDRLALLRKELAVGSLTWVDYALDAAQAYLEGEKPIRASALLGTLSQPDLDDAQRAAYERLPAQIQGRAPLPYSTCSLNMIVRDEEAFIADALDSVDAIMDEVVICDTGSTDHTPDLALRYGVTMIHDTWRKDFSYHRNRAIEASRCDWILWIDADDRVEETSLHQLEQLWRTGKPQGATFCVVNEREDETPVEFLQVRLFPRRDDVRFQQRIHEQIMYSLSGAGIPFSKRPDIRIRHLGYRDAATQRSKAARNKPLILTELTRNPGDPTLWLSLADCLATLDEIDEAMLAYSEVIGNPEAWGINSDVYVQAHINLARLFLKREEPRQAKRYLYRTLYLDPQRAEAFLALARLLLSEGDEQHAAEYFLKCARINPPLRMTAVDNTRVRLEALYYLAEILIERSDHEQVINLLGPAVDAYPCVPQYHRQLGCAFLAGGDLKKAARNFCRSIQLCPENNTDSYTGMAQVYEKLGDAVTARTYLAKAACQSK